MGIHLALKKQPLLNDIYFVLCVYVEVKGQVDGVSSVLSFQQGGLGD